MAALVVGVEDAEPRVEIVVAVVSPAGSDAESVSDVLADALESVGYESKLVRISELIETGIELDSYEEKTRIRRLMDKGDYLRREAQDGAFCGLLAVQAIRETRASVTGDEGVLRRSGATIVRSLKHPDEVTLLRRVYGRRLVVVGVSEEREARQERLRKLLLKEKGGKKTAELESWAAGEAAALVMRDEKDEQDPFGQRVRDAYEMCDVYLPTTKKELEASARRLVGLLFGEPFTTPSRDEMGVWHAHAAKFRSSAAGRQVGAVITDDDGEVLVTGCNDVPAPLGGQNWEGDEDDYRDFEALGRDANDSKKFDLVSEVLGALGQAGWFGADLAGLGAEELTRRALEGKGAPLRKTRVDDLLEFGRIMHAEMAALMTAARRGTPVRGATLYTTTYPCHECMRLILGAGIKRVVYVDAYPKSLVSDLYGDHLEGSSGKGSKVTFERFVGIAPQLIEQVFDQVSGRRRNLEGKYQKWVAKEAIYVGSQDRYHDMTLLQEQFAGQTLKSYLDEGFAKATQDSDFPSEGGEAE